MRVLRSLLFLCLILSAIPKGQAIIGGENATWDDKTWLVNLNDGCSASKIASGWLITAAHCIGEMNYLKSGNLDKSLQEEFGKIKRVILHEKFKHVNFPEYDDVMSINDIALIEYEVNDFNEKAETISLFSDQESPYTETELFVYGWGVTKFVQGLPLMPDELKGGVFDLLNQKETEDQLHKAGNDYLIPFYDNYAFNGLIPFSSDKFHACWGDSGTAVVVQDERTGKSYLRAILVGGAGRGCRSIAHASDILFYAQWIRSHIESI